MKKIVKYLFTAPASFLAVIPAVSCGCTNQEDPVKDVIPTDKLVIKNGVLSGFVDGFNPKEYKILEIPDTVTTISENAFTNNFTGSDCQLKKIVIPNSVKTIYSKAFYGNDAINTYNLSSFTTTKGYDWKSDVFGNSASTGSIIYPNSNDDTLDNDIDYLMCDSGLALGWFDTTKERVVETDFLDWNKTDNILYGFKDEYFEVPHTSLFTKLEIPYVIQNIANNAFYKEGKTTLQSIKKVEFGIDPETEFTHVQTIGENAFRSSLLRNITFKSGTSTIKKSAFQDCKNLTVVSLPDTLVTIEETAFANCSSITEIQIPTSLVNLQTHAFYNCSQLSKIDLSGVYKVLTSWSEDAFVGISKTGKIYCEPSVAPEWKTYFTKSGILFTDNAWTITDKIDLLNGYTSLIDPYPITSETTKDVLQTTYFSAVQYTSQILVDDLYHSFFEWTKTINQDEIRLDKFEGLIKSASADFDEQSFSFNFYYSVKGVKLEGGVEKETFEAEGNMNIKNIPFIISYAENVETPIVEPETESRKFVKMVDDTFSTKKRWYMTLNENYKLGAAEQHEISNLEVDYTNIDDFKTMKVSETGVFWNLNRFLDYQNETWSWGILSSYLQNITVKD